MDQFKKAKEIIAMVGLYDLEAFLQLAESMPTIKLFNLMLSIFSIAKHRISSGKGKLIKHLGDGSIFLYPEQFIDNGVRTVLTLKAELEQFLEKKGLKNRVSFCMDAGPIAIGKMPPFNAIDIIGRPLNNSFSLLRHANNRTIITNELFVRLTKDTQKKFRFLEAQNFYFAE